MFGSRPGGGLRRFSRDWELYQAVTPGEPEGKGRSCLIAETELVEVEDDGTMMEGVGRSRVRVLG